MTTEGYGVERRVQIIKFYFQNQCSVRETSLRKITFNDETHFSMNGYVNKQNRRIRDDTNAHGMHRHQNAIPEKVTVWCGFWSGRIIGPHFFRNDTDIATTVSGERYRPTVSNLSWP